MKHRVGVACAIFIPIASIVLWCASPAQPVAPEIHIAQHVPAIAALPITPAAAQRRSSAAASASASSAFSAPQDASFLRMKRLLSGDPVRGKISREVINAFLAERNRSALSLLVAWQESGNDDLLREMAERFPDDTRVQIAMLATDLSDEERMQWIARFKASAPDNALADYYAAAEFLKMKDVESAVAELVAGNAKRGYEDYMMDQMAEREALFRAAGLPETEARVQSLFGGQMPFLSVLNKIRGDLIPEIRARLAAGETRSAIDLGAIGVTMATKMQDGSASHVLLNELVSIAVERNVLEALGTSAADELLGQSSEPRLAELAQRRDEIRELSQVIDAKAQEISSEDLTRYFQVLVNDGELQALKWLKSARLGSRP